MLHHWLSFFSFIGYDLLMIPIKSNLDSLTVMKSQYLNYSKYSTPGKKDSVLPVKQLFPKKWHGSSLTSNGKWTGGQWSYTNSQECPGSIAVRDIMGTRKALKRW
jgi:hypothetical protein